MKDKGKEPSYTTLIEGYAAIFFFFFALKIDFNYRWQHNIGELIIEKHPQMC